MRLTKQRIKDIYRFIDAHMSRAWYRNAIKELLEERKLFIEIENEHNRIIKSINEICDLYGEPRFTTSSHLSVVPNGDDHE